MTTENQKLGLDTLNNRLAIFKIVKNKQKTERLGILLASKRDDGKIAIAFSKKRSGDTFNTFEGLGIAQKRTVKAVSTPYLPPHLLGHNIHLLPFCMQGEVFERFLKRVNRYFKLVVW